MLRKIRIIIASITFILITLLFLDFTGTVHLWFGWLTKIQFWPAVMAANLIVIVSLLILTLVFGRVYCSVICPLGIFQDIFEYFGHKGKKPNYSYKKANNILRYGLLGIFVLVTILSLSFLDSLIEPYSAFGRIANSIFQPIWMLGNNLLAAIAERVNSYAFYSVDVWIKSLPTLIIAVITLVVVVVMAWRGGRNYCNTICPIGTILGFVSKYSLFHIQIDQDQCVKCGLCAKNCKSSCIDVENKTIDGSRCVACMNCLDHCKKKGIRYKFVGWSKKSNLTTAPSSNIQNSRRGFISGVALFAASKISAQQHQHGHGHHQNQLKMDGGYADVFQKHIPAREQHLVPAGSLSASNLKNHCTSCQLCVSACPNNVLRPSSKLATFMQPEMSFERGYCRPECVKCSEVCPTAAIQKISVEEKSSIQVGHAVWRKEYCIVLTDGQNCDNCARHCPSKAITMVNIDPNNPKSRKIPAVNTERCIGCGACENLCIASPFSAMYVEGHLTHKFI